MQPPQAGKAQIVSPMTTENHVRTYLALAVTLLFWASAFAGIRAGLQAYGPGHLALFRFAVASVTLAILAVLKGIRLPAKRDIPGIALLGFLGISVYHTALNYGERTVTAGAASLLIAAGPIFTALFSTLFQKERLKPVGWLGIVISFIGVAIITVGEGQGLAFEPGALLILLSALVTSIYFVFQKPFHTRYSPQAFTTYSLMAGTLFLFVFLPGLPQAIKEAPPEATLSVIYLGVFPAAIAYITWNYALSRLPAAVVSSFLYVNPVLAILIAWFWLQEIPSMLSLIGGAGALAGVIIINRWGK